MSDIVDRLRDYRGGDVSAWVAMEDAADTIIRLTAENEKLRAALAEHACKCSVKGEGAGGNCTRGTGECSSWTARAALTQPMKLYIDDEKFLAAIDREGDHEVGAGNFPPLQETSNE